MKTVTPDNYQADPLYRRVVNALRHLQQTKGEITPINVLVTLGFLTPAQILQWRQGHILFLEAILQSNLSKTNRVLRILRLHARDLDLRCIQTDYLRLGAGPRKILHFTKSGDANIERAYSRVYLPPAPPEAVSSPSDRASE